MTNSNPAIQKLMEEAQAIKPDDPDMMKKMTEIAQKIAQVQGKAKAKVSGNDAALVDPMDELGCEGCQ